MGNRFFRPNRPNGAPWELRAEREEKIWLLKTWGTTLAIWTTLKLYGGLHLQFGGLPCYTENINYENLGDYTENYTIKIVGDYTGNSTRDGQINL